MGIRYRPATIGVDLIKKCMETINMSYEQYAAKIYALDAKIKNENDQTKRNELLNEAIKVNQDYIEVLRKPLPWKIALCVILSVFFFLGLIIFLPQIIIRNSKAKICENRIATYMAMKGE